jgi:hypothetical protein
MNTIYGANDKKKFLDLQKLNNGDQKQNNAMLFLKDDSFDIYKVHALSKDFKIPRKKYHTLLGICENRTRTFNAEKMNPYISNKWIISCCGEITNKKEIIENKDALKKDQYINSIVLCTLFDYIELNFDNELDVLRESFSLLEGNYSTWIHSVESRNTYLFKCNVDLYADIYENTFSTLPFDGSDALTDGEIYQLTREGITNVDTCDCSE